MTLSQHHQELDENGRGKCSVPMWSMGIPAGFCDKEAFGVRPPSRTWWNYAAKCEMREDGRYSGYVPALACPGHGGPKTRVFKDGNAWCAVQLDFINLQESPIGFGETPEEARKNLELELSSPSLTEAEK
jgi:hypothetical protein